ncbi:uncharacterized protein BX663DRAFT_483157 [Cokeromyces recurvatus]|uniref:uncharacterized protein n=1 Tax=Cokeromyces recurvatus TaxID=90255 RepID=UPI00221F1B10|nr:uncharacterized protein BX663DRAFT_483157 [Cokeromyces recurvatus]KAI7906411.1 hypothetical protein BX663DRAFT_483157 [Cokeromyces recurvatus]
MLSDNQHDIKNKHKHLSFLSNPNDPSVEDGYEALIQEWKTQLVNQQLTAPPSYDYVRLTWMRLMDHYLDQHWLDSKQMLQCAQVWSTRDSIHISEAVYTMNILGLKFMKRSLDARKELLQALGDPIFMSTLGVLPIKNINLDTSLASTCFYAEEEEEDEGPEVHAPLFMNHESQKNDDFNLERYSSMNHINDIPIEKMDEGIVHQVQEENDNEAIDLYAYDDSHVKEEEEDEDEIGNMRQAYDSSFMNHFGLTFSRSTPNISTKINEDGSSSQYNKLFRKYESCHQQLYKLSSWKDIELNVGENNVLDNQSICSSIHPNYESCSPMISNCTEWKSWFTNQQEGEFYNPEEQRYPLEPSSIKSNPILLLKEEFANEKVETDESFSNLYFSSNSQKASCANTEISPTSFMVRSESNISTFRPISNNLAPRCHQLMPTPIPNSMIKRSSSYFDTSKDNRPILSDSNECIHTICSRRATITKSKSFPSKITSTSVSIKKPYSDASIPQKERNFTIRSIVNKKVSFSRLFSSKKSSSSSLNTTAH